VGGDLAAVARVADDEDLLLADAVDDEVIEDAAVLPAARGVGGAADGQRADGVGHQPVGHRDRLGPPQAELAHVADVEHAGPLPDGVMLGDDALVLDGHLVAGEGNHAAAGGDVGRVERGAGEGTGHGRGR
jgi:hypothetical protein